MDGKYMNAKPGRKAGRKAWTARILAGLLAAVTLLGLCLPALAAESGTESESGPVAAFETDPGQAGPIDPEPDGNGQAYALKAKHGRGGCIRHSGVFGKQVRKDILACRTDKILEAKQGLLQDAFRKSAKPGIFGRDWVRNAK